MSRFKSQVAVVTGGASGLGKAIARRLAADGATVVITDVQSEQGARTASEYGLHFITHNVSDENHWSRVIDEVESRFGGLKILVNNAGVIETAGKASAENCPLSDWKRIFSVNVEGVFLGCRFGIRAMRRSGGGSIINMSSTAGLIATPDNVAYGASKAAVRHLTKSVAQYCAERQLHIRCNSVHPGIIITPLWEKLAIESAEAAGVTVEDILAEAKAMCPLNEFTLPEDVAATVAFLASEEARHMTGAKLMVDGGIVDCDTFRLRDEKSLKKLAAEKIDD